jgi:Fe2+ or Zn2+ uptake regulation protein
MADSLEKIQTEHRRLQLLLLLRAAQGYASNETVLKDQLALAGHQVSADRLRTDLAWLAEQGLIQANQVSDRWVVRLLERGEDVASGVASTPGVACPKPRPRGGSMG